MAKIHAGILGTGHAYPEGILTNADLEKLVDTSDEWITSRTGIKQRRKAAPGEYTSLFAVRAAREAIERARIDPAEIDTLICATVTLSSAPTTPPRLIWPPPVQAFSMGWRWPTA
jgi:3-oxoacyl-[acyl-carrier-protein] synthase III